jgi:hypothetical protein
MPKFLVTVEMSLDYTIEAASADEAKSAIARDMKEWDWIADDFMGDREYAMISVTPQLDTAEVDMGVADGKTVAAYDWEQMKKDQASGG